ncbi:MAG: hypothetical protein M9962_01525 [Oligoflexia bacterium]|nr:hypothetical protein [Oligoflexia bacterium]
MFFLFTSTYSKSASRITSMELIKKLEIEFLENSKPPVKDKDLWLDKKLTLIALYRLVGKSDLAEQSIESSYEFFKNSKSKEWAAHLEWLCNQEKSKEFCKKK